jgi:putative transcriptional regulator
MNMAVTTHLREVRKSKGLTQKEVAEAILISKDSLSRYERGEQDPRLDVAIRLSKYYNVSMESLYDIQN